jgi:hypothetical protein
MEDGTISRLSNAYSLRQGRRLTSTSEVEELQYVIVILRRKYIKPSHWGGKHFLRTGSLCVQRRNEAERGVALEVALGPLLQHALQLLLDPRVRPGVNVMILIFFSKKR